MPEGKFTPKEIGKAHEEALEIDKKAEEMVEKGEAKSEQEAVENKVLLSDLLEKNELPEEEIEEVLTKVKDLRSGDGVLTHVSWIKNLDRILQEGILSHKFAKRAYEKVSELPSGYDPVTQGKYGMEKISFWDGDYYKEILSKRYKQDFYKYIEDMADRLLTKDKETREKAISIFVQGGIDKIIKEYPDFGFSFSESWPRRKEVFDSLVIWENLVEESLPKGQKFSREALNSTREEAFEKMKAQELRKRNFLSIMHIHEDRFAVVLDKAKLPPSKKEQRLYDWFAESLVRRRITPRFFSGLIVNSRDEIQSEIFASLIDFLKERKIPVYNEDGDIIWPKQMKFEEVEDWLEQKREISTKEIE